MQIVMVVPTPGQEAVSLMLLMQLWQILHAVLVLIPELEIAICKIVQEVP